MLMLLWYTVRVGMARIWVAGGRVVLGEGTNAESSDSLFQ